MYTNYKQSSFFELFYNGGFDMKKKKLFLTALLTTSIGLFSCGGGNDSGSSNSYSPTGSVYLPYMASLDFVDPITGSVVNVESKKVLYAENFTKALKFDKKSYEVENDYVVYITDEGNEKGKIFKVSLAECAPQPVQISNVSDACSVVGSYNDNNVSYLIVQTAGNDGQCETSDDKNVFVNTNMSAGTSPIDMSHVKRVIDDFMDYNNLKITGFLILNTSNKLQKCDTNLQNCSDILSANNSNSVDDLGHYDINRDEYYLCVNDYWFRIFPDGNYRNTNASCSIQSGWTADKDYVYFYTEDLSGNKTIKKLSKANDTVVSLYTTTNTVYMQGNTIDYVIIEEHNSSTGTYYLKAINKSNGSVVDIKSSNQDINSVTNYKHLVLYSYYDGSNLRACYWDGATNQNNCNSNNSYWGGGFVKRSGNISFDYSDGEMDMELEPYKFILVENYKDIYSVNPDNPSEKTFVGSLPDRYTAHFVDGLGSSGLLMAQDKNYKYDIFLMDVDNKVLKQITNTPDKSEVAIAIW